MTKWFVVGGVLVIFGVISVLDWTDGPSSHPDGPLVYALLILAGAALGWAPPWTGRGKE